MNDLRTDGNDDGSAATSGLPNGKRMHFRLARFATGIAILVAYLMVGDLLSSTLHIPLPGSVLGMVLLTLSLHAGILRSHWVAPAANLLIRHMGFLFVPPGVGLMVHFGLIRKEWLPIGVGALVSVVAVLATVGLLQQRLERR